MYLRGVNLFRKIGGEIPAGNEIRLPVQGGCHLGFQRAFRQAKRQGSHDKDVEESEDDVYDNKF